MASNTFLFLLFRPHVRTLASFHAGRCPAQSMWSTSRCSVVPHVSKVLLNTGAETCCLPEIAAEVSNGSSSTQAELVTISMALLHAEETGAGQSVIYSDSVAALKAIMQYHLTTNIRLVNSICQTLEVLSAVVRHVTFIWQPNHLGIEGNGAADATANDVTLLPAVTVQLPPPDPCLLHNTGGGSADYHRRPGTSSGRVVPVWILVRVHYRYGPLPPWPLYYPRSTRVHLHRLRLGYRCANELDPDNIIRRDCEHCEEEQDTTLIHFLQECPGTRDALADPDGHSAPALLLHKGVNILARMVRDAKPPR